MSDSTSATPSMLEQVVAQQKAMIEALQAQLAEVAQRLPPLPEAAPAPGQYLEFPRVVYRKQAKLDAKQIDHPGQDAITVRSAAELEAAQADGWTLEPFPHVYADAEPDPAPAVKATAKGKR